MDLIDLTLLDEDETITTAIKNDIQTNIKSHHLLPRKGTIFEEVDFSEIDFLVKFCATKDKSGQPQSGKPIGIPQKPERPKEEKNIELKINKSSNICSKSNSLILSSEQQNNVLQCSPATPSAKTEANRESYSKDVIDAGNGSNILRSSVKTPSNTSENKSSAIIKFLQSDPLQPSERLEKSDALAVIDTLLGGVNGSQEVNLYHEASLRVISNGQQKSSIVDRDTHNNKNKRDCEKFLSKDDKKQNESQTPRKKLHDIETSKDKDSPPKMELSSQQPPTSPDSISIKLIQIIKDRFSLENDEKRMMSQFNSNQFLECGENEVEQSSIKVDTMDSMLIDLTESMDETGTQENEEFREDVCMICENYDATLVQCPYCDCFFHRKCAKDIIVVSDEQDLSDITKSPPCPNCLDNTSDLDDLVDDSELTNDDWEFYNQTFKPLRDSVQTYFSDPNAADVQASFRDLVMSNEDREFERITAEIDKNRQEGDPTGIYSVGFAGNLRDRSSELFDIYVKRQEELLKGRAENKMSKDLQKNLNTDVKDKASDFNNENIVNNRISELKDSVENNIAKTIEFQPFETQAANIERKLESKT